MVTRTGGTFKGVGHPKGCDALAKNSLRPTCMLPAVAQKILTQKLTHDLFVLADVLVCI